jgi:protein phosphatase
MILPVTKLEVAELSERGYLRNENQDRMIGTAVPLGHLFIVADGMGGHKGGGVAAEITVNRLRHFIGQAPPDAVVENIIRSAFKKVNQEIYLKAHSGQDEIEGMGSTAVLLLISGCVARVAHVGDSRAYLFHRGRLHQLTTDHTLVQKMVERGMLDANEAFDHPNANILERAIGSKPSVEVDITDELTLDNGDAMLLCTDGLTGYVLDSEILRVLLSREVVQEIPKRLVDLALHKGGKDNVTIQFIQYGTREKTPVNPQDKREKKLRKRLFFMVLVLLCSALLAGGIFFYLERKLAQTQPLLQKAQDSAALSRGYAIDLGKQRMIPPRRE